MLNSVHRDTFIYEYVGDVVSHPTFVKRMRQYAEEGIRHFYFMMLQKDEVRSHSLLLHHQTAVNVVTYQYIDATKRGGIGRFANHSCNPNCYVAKWTVGKHVRMGIFANRNIKKDEELTFNYNVDRYGCVVFSLFKGLFLIIYVDMRHSHVIVERQSVLASLEGKPKRILPLWMTSTWMVRLTVIR